MAVKKTSNKDKKYRTTAPKTTAKATKTATVRQGDNLFNLAERYKTTYSALAKANPSIKKLLPGQTVRVPKQYPRAGSKRPTTGMGDLRAFEANQPAYTQTGSLGNFETGTTNYMAYINQPTGAAPAPVPYTGTAPRVTTALPDTQRAQAQRVAPGMGQAPIDPRTGQYNLAYLVDPTLKVNGGAMGFGKTYSSGTGQGPFDEYGRYNLAFLRNVVAPAPPQYQQSSDVWVAPQASSGGGYTGYSGGGYGNGGGGGGGYKNEPYQGFTGTANRNPFGVAASNDRLFGAGIGLINWRI